jgi:hypothetical protein
MAAGRNDPRAGPSEQERSRGSQVPKMPLLILHRFPALMFKYLVYA